MTEHPLDMQYLFDLLIGLVISMLGFFGWNIHNDLEKTKDALDNAASEIGRLSTHVAENYAHNGRIDEIKSSLAHITQRLDDIYKAMSK